jgi:hypothetical protein
LSDIGLALAVDLVRHMSHSRHFGPCRHPLAKGDPPVTRPTLLRLRTLTATVAVGALGTLLVVDAPDPPAGPRAAEVVALAPVASSSVPGHRWAGHPNRRVLVHRVRRGETATGLAVRYHAWTAELRALNHLGRHSRLYTGERIRIPIVVSAWRRDHPHRRPVHHRTAHRSHAKPQAKPRAHPQPRAHTHPWRNADASRATVRKVVVTTARRHGLHPNLLLAISWQESGWQQRRVSSAGAIGAMQVMPDTGRWVSTYAGRRLNLYGLQDNVTAGVLVVKILKKMTSGGRVIGAYYQGLGSIQKHKMYPSTKRYVANVRQLRRMIQHGRPLY